jgi:ATP-dependent Lon protease
MTRKCLYIFKKGKKKGTQCSNQMSNTNLSYCKNHSNQINNIQLFQTQVKEEDSIKNRILELPTNFQNKSVLLKHYDNIKRADSNSTEYYKNLTFVNNGISVPWNKYYHISNIIEGIAIPEFLSYIQQELDKKIYGMQNVKNEIINYICKMITNPKGTKNNIALYGPAGVAKSKFVDVISDVLGIPVKSMSLGGVKDSSFFLGHGYVYVESSPGKILQNIIDSKVMNPILYFDELDKVSSLDGGKDIFSFLTYLTDYTQNYKFSDHYFYGMSFDLSKVFYIFTFNDIEKIDKVLLDRLNIIYVESPSIEEKVSILENYCLEEIVTNIGITKKIKISEECYRFIVESASKTIDLNLSSGIRESYRILEKIILQINKDILLEKWNDKHKIINITFEIFKDYFSNLRYNNNNQSQDTSHLHMYI